MIPALEQLLGALLMLLVLADVYLTVLYARVGTGIISEKLARVVWRFFGISQPSAAFPRCYLSVDPR